MKELVGTSYILLRSEDGRHSVLSLQEYARPTQYNHTHTFESKLYAMFDYSEWQKLFPQRVLFEIPVSNETFDSFVLECTKEGTRV